MATDEKINAPFSSKRCPDCATELPLKAKRCVGCGNRVGPVDRNGRAKKPVDLLSYIVCLISWLVFGLYIWWAFFRK